MRDLKQDDQVSRSWELARLRDLFGPVQTDVPMSRGIKFSFKQRCSESILSYDRTRNNKFDRREAWYVAAELNNWAVIWGLGEPQLPLSSCDFSGEVYAILRKHFPQLWLMPPAGTRIVPKIRAPNPMATYPAAVGINIGQTLVKIYRMLGTNRFRDSFPTPTSASTLATCLSRKTLGIDNSVAVAISVGGLVSDGVIIPGSGVARRFSGPGETLYLGLPDALGNQFGPAVVMQDATAKATLYATQGFSDTLLLDIGTSLGAVYLDFDSALPSQLSQVGRVARRTGPDALARPDGGGIGALSQYLSLSSFLHDMGIQTPPHRFHELVARDIDLQRRLSDYLAERVRTVIEVLRPYYGNVTKIVITGGLILSAQNESWVKELPGASLAQDPLWDSAKAMALIANGEIVITS